MAELLYILGHRASVYGTIYYLNQKFDLGFTGDKDELGECLAGRSLNCALSYVEIDNDGKFVRGEFFDTEHLEPKMLTSNLMKSPKRMICI